MNMKELSPWRIRRAADNEDLDAEYWHVPHRDESNLSAYWNILVKRRRTIILLFLVIVALGVYFTSTATKLYTASATLQIEPRNLQITERVPFQAPEGMGSQYGGQYDYYQTQFALLKSRPLAARVITSLGLASKETFTQSRTTSSNPLDRVRSWTNDILGSLSSIFSRADPRSDESAVDYPVGVRGGNETQLKVPSHLINRYQEFLNIAQVPKTRLAKIEFTTPDAALSQALANAHAQSFLETSLESRFTLTTAAREFLEKKKTELTQKMEKSEAALNEFRRAHGVLSVDKGENIVVDRLIELNKQLTAAQAHRIETESLYRTVENRNYQDLSEVMKQGLVQQLKSNVATLEAERARSATIFKPDHPKMQEMNQQITAARQDLNNEIASVVRSIRSNFAAAQAKERGLQVEANKQQQDALKLKELGVNYTILNEDLNANKSLYESVLKRLSETNVSNDIAVSNMQVVEGADKPLNPSSPNMPLYLLATLISGLFFAVGIAFLQECFDSTVGTPADVWRSVGLGTLGVVPHLKFLNGQADGVPSNYVRTDRLTACLDGVKRIVDKLAGLHKSKQSSAGEKDLILSHRPIAIINQTYRTIRTGLLQLKFLNGHAEGVQSNHVRADRLTACLDGVKRIVDYLEGLRKAKQSSAGEKDLILSHHPIAIINEAYRTIRTALLLSQAEKPPQVVLLTSPSPGEGKTVTTVNLGIALAQDGYSVLVVDGDMRRGRCHSALGLSNNRGLSNVLTGGLSLQEGIQPTPVSGLFLLSRGVLPPNPTELLGSAKMRGVLQELRAAFQFILIDSPPIVTVTDAAVLSVASDGVLLVFDGQKTSTVSAQKAVERLDMIRARLLGVILNAINLDNPDYSEYRAYPSYSNSPNGGNGNGQRNGNVSVAAPWASDQPTTGTPNITARYSDGGDHKSSSQQSNPGLSSVAVETRHKTEQTYDNSQMNIPEQLWSENHKEEAPVSKEVLSQIIQALTEVMGPSAPLIVREQIAILGESEDAFPKARITELVNLCKHEIIRDELARFQLRISEQLRNLENDNV